jgi:ankyrin repeat protein
MTSRWSFALGLVYMNDAVALILSSLRESCDFAESDLSGINACAGDGDNALHVLVRRDDLSGAKALIEAGIDINKAGDLGYTPLHNACMRGNMDMVKLLVEKGADLFALSEGDSPFTSARLGGHDRVCEVLAPLMQQAQSHDPKIWLRAKLTQLRREAANIEAQLDRV